MSTPWIFLVIFPALGLLVYFLSMNDEDGGIMNPQNKDDVVGLIIFSASLFVMMTGLTILMFKMKLETSINQDGIYFRYPPIINKERFISRAEISSFEVRRYSPNREYGGHGVKKGKRKSGRAYTVSGREGLQLYLTNGQKILIGSHRKEAIKSAMAKMMSNDY